MFFILVFIFKVRVSAGEILYLPSLWFHHLQQSHVSLNYILYLPSLWFQHLQQSHVSLIFFLY